MKKEEATYFMETLSKYISACVNNLSSPTVNYYYKELIALVEAIAVEKESP